MHEKDYLHQNDFSITIIDHLQSMIAVVDVKSLELVDLNRYALDFYGIKDFEAFKKSHTSIYKTFQKVDDPLFLQDDGLGSMWIMDILDDTSVNKVMILGRIFRVLGYMANETHMIVTFDDITELERQNSAIVQQNQLLESYMDIIDQFTLVTKSDPYGKLSYVNETFCRVFGYASDELIGRPLKEIIAPTVVNSLFPEIRECMDEVKTWNGIFEGYSKTSQVIYLQATIAPILNSDQISYTFFGMYENITDLHEQRFEELSESIEKALDINLQLIVDAIPMSAVVVDSQSHIQAANAYFDELSFGFNDSLVAIDELFIAEEGFVSSDPIFDWKDLAIDLSISETPRVLLDIDGIHTVFELYIQKYADSDDYVVCFVRTCERGL
jgi:PAS domain S-box-containing protein